MRGKTRALVGGLAAACLVVGGAFIADAATTVTPVAKLCKNVKTKVVYQRGTCLAGEQAITLKGLKGADGVDGVDGKDGAQGPAGDSASIVRKCATVKVDADYQALPFSQRQVTLEGLPAYESSGSDDMWRSNAGGVPDGFAAGISVVQVPRINGQTTARFRINPSGFSASESFDLRICDWALDLS